MSPVNPLLGLMMCGGFSHRVLCDVEGVAGAVLVARWHLGTVSRGLTGVDLVSGVSCRFCGMRLGAIVIDTLRDRYRHRCYLGETRTVSGYLYQTTERLHGGSMTPPSWIWLGRPSLLSPRRS